MCTFGRSFRVVSCVRHKVLQNFMSGGVRGPLKDWKHVQKKIGCSQEAKYGLSSALAPKVIIPVLSGQVLSVLCDPFLAANEGQPFPRLASHT